jgi:pilus assembly protein CpaE
LIASLAPMRGIGDQRGQATVELVAVLPFVAVIGALLVQAAIAGQSIWLAQSAAGAAARAQAVGNSGERAARAALPDRLERGLRLRPGAGGGVRVSVRVPSLWGGDLGSVDASARMEPQR